MDPELLSVIKRYLFVGFVLGASVIWTVWYTTDSTRPSNGAPTLEALVAAAPAVAATSSSWVVERSGKPHVLCEPACKLEEQCGLRTRAACMSASCDGDLRKMNASDFALEKASNDCQAVVVTPCEEACARQGECSKDHTGDAACTQACMTLMKSAPTKTWQQARCILETRTCVDVEKCRS